MRTPRRQQEPRSFAFTLLLLLLLLLLPAQLLSSLLQQLPIVEGQIHSLSCVCTLTVSAPLLLLLPSRMLLWLWATSAAHH
jgi:hypothetical protein